jgi:hypothetical protein
LKLPLLLTQYLYLHKKLNLPGIGSFILDPSAILPDEHNKDPHAVAVGIEFKNAVITEPDDELIEFIRVHTGKMKSLALADLDSFITLGTELVNIGKPFYLEGIGMLTKNKDGKYDFKPGEYSTIRLDDPGSGKAEKREKAEFALNEPGYEYEPRTNRLRKLLLIGSVIGGLAIIGWGGYMLYMKNTAPTNEGDLIIIPKDTAARKTESEISLVSRADSSQSKKTGNSGSLRSRGDSVLYKFNILETHNKIRALKRYNQLLSFKLKISMYTRDSSFFKVYFAFPARSKDTVHIKDSLNREYGHSIHIDQ